MAIKIVGADHARPLSMTTPYVPRMMSSVTGVDRAINHAMIDAVARTMIETTIVVIIKAGPKNDSTTNAAIICTIGATTNGAEVAPDRPNVHPATKESEMIVTDAAHPRNVISQKDGIIVAVDPEKRSFRRFAMPSFHHLLQQRRRRQP